MGKIGKKGKSGFPSLHGNDSRRAPKGPVGLLSATEGLRGVPRDLSGPERLRMGHSSCSNV